MAEGNGKEVAKVSPPRLPYHPDIEARFGIDKSGWRAITDAVFPSASTTDAVILADRDAIDLQLQYLTEILMDARSLTAVEAADVARGEQ